MFFCFRGEDEHSVSALKFQFDECPVLNHETHVWQVHPYYSTRFTEGINLNK